MRSFTFDEWSRRDGSKGVSSHPKVLRKQLGSCKSWRKRGTICSYFDLSLYKPLVSSWGKLKGKLISLFQRDKLSFFLSSHLMCKLLFILCLSSMSSDPLIFLSLPDYQKIKPNGNWFPCKPLPCQ